MAIRVALATVVMIHSDAPLDASLEPVADPGPLPIARVPVFVPSAAAAPPTSRIRLDTSLRRWFARNLGVRVALDCRDARSRFACETGAFIAASETVLDACDGRRWKREGR